MVKISKAKIKNSLLLLIVFILAGCANQLPPGGGDVDHIPPEIIKSYPADGTINFKDDHFELTFSEYVDKRSVKDAIFISPAIEGNLELDWTGTSVDAYFPDKLRDSVTYVVTIGTDVVDYNNHNRMAQSYNFTFSTGNKIDKRIIAGRVYDKKSDGILIFAYNTKHDTINPMKLKPDYISQTGMDGRFKLLGLAKANYRVFAIDDQYRDLLFQPGQDRFGVAYKEINLSRKDTLFSNLNFFLSKFDTTKPRLLSAVMTDKYHALVKFTKDVDTSVVSPANFTFWDSTKNKKINSLYAFKGATKPDEIVLVPKDTLPVSDEFILIADSVKDNFGNLFLSDSIAMILSDKPDTTKPELFKTIPRNGSHNVDFNNAQFSFFFNDGFNELEAKKEISFADTLGNTVPFNLSFMDNSSFVIKPKIQLQPSKIYDIRINAKNIKDVSGNFVDTVYNYRFSTISGLDFTGVSGSVDSLDLNKNPKLVLQSASSQDKKYQLGLESSKFNFTRIEAGKYLLWCYYDRDSSNTYTYGKLYPFQPSEEFFFYPDTLNLRPRWSVTDVKFNLNPKTFKVTKKP